MFYLSKKQQQKRLNQYRSKLNITAEKIIGILIEDNLKVVDFNNLVAIINQRFNKSFNDTEVKSLVEYAQRN